MKRLAQILLMCSAGFLFLAFWEKDRLPEAASIHEALFNEPQQVRIDAPAFDVRVKEIEYQIQPLYTYDLYGVVVSKHDSDTWWDYLHAEWGDHLNVADLCVVWGDNVRTSGYHDVAFSSGQFVCYYRPRSREAHEAFNKNQMSNNHLLGTDRAVIKAISEARVGDQVHFSGYLAKYSHNHGKGFTRGTSIVRTDTGNGACETVFVQKFEILERGNTHWVYFLKIAIAALIAGLITWFAAPPHLGPEDESLF